MSKPLTRVSVAVLIGLIIVIGAFATVQAAAVSSGSLEGRVDAAAADPYYAGQQRGISQELSPFAADTYKEGHGCEGKMLDSNDY